MTLNGDYSVNTGYQTIDIIPLQLKTPERSEEREVFINAYNSRISLFEGENSRLQNKKLVWTIAGIFVTAVAVTLVALFSTAASFIMIIGCISVGALGLAISIRVTRYFEHLQELIANRRQSLHIELLDELPKNRKDIIKKTVSENVSHLEVRIDDITDIVSNYLDQNGCTDNDRNYDECVVYDYAYPTKYDKANIIPDTLKGAENFSERVRFIKEFHIRQRSELIKISLVESASILVGTGCLSLTALAIAALFMFAPPTLFLLAVLVAGAGLGISLLASGCVNLFIMENRYLYQRFADEMAARRRVEEKAKLINIS